MAEGGTGNGESPDYETIAKLAGAFAAILYVIGLLAINGYLFSLGVSDFSLARPRFVYTGALILFITAIYLLIPVYGFKVTEDSIRSGHLITRLFNILPLIIVPPIFVGLILAAVNRSIDSFYSVSVFSFVVYPIALLCAALSLMLVRFFLHMEGTWGFLKFGRLVFVMSNVTILVGLYLAAFMAFLYPKIPEQFGGGEPVRAVLLIKEDALEGARNLGLPTQTGKPLTEPLDLMYEGSQAYVIRLTDRSIVRLDKSAVVGVRIYR
jgi:hypothetical protein